MPSTSAKTWLPSKALLIYPRVPDAHLLTNAEDRLSFATSRVPRPGMASLERLLSGHRRPRYTFTLCPVKPPLSLITSPFFPRGEKRVNRSPRPAQHEDNHGSHRHARTAPGEHFL